MMFIIAACPDIISRDITGSHEFIIMACDGIWDVMSNQEVVQFVRARIAQRAEPSVVSNSIKPLLYASVLCAS
mgnify:CR=1 FL=1